MGCRHRREVQPSIERIEPRLLLSNITSLMASNDLMSRHQMAAVGGGVSAAASQYPPFVPSTTALDQSTGQGPQGLNQALTPTGTLTPQELKRERFVARFVGPYAIGPGQTDTQAMQTSIRGAGGSNTFLHGDIQLKIITPTNPTNDPMALNSGVSAIFDRNLNSNTTLGLDFSGPIGNVDSNGRPNHFNQVAIDVNESSGVYDEAISQGTIDIKYIPSGKHTPGVIDQGTAIVTIHAQIYTTQVDYILANADLNPGGPSASGPDHHRP